MEMILIGDRKLKVMLSPEDLRDFDMKAKDLDYTNTETKKMFWDILSRAKRSVGFNTDGCRVFVQLFPSKKGGCEIFVTKLSHAEESESSDVPEGSEKPTPNGQNTYLFSGKEPRIHAFAFGELEALLAVCRRLNTADYLGASSAYLGDNRRFYLLLENTELCEYLPLHEFSFIDEYGSSEPFSTVSVFLKEHAQSVCAENAVQILGKF